MNLFQQQKASDDLLQLAGNPFADMFGAPQPAAPQPAPPQNNMWMTNGNEIYQKAAFYVVLFVHFVIVII